MAFSSHRASKESHRRHEAWATGARFYLKNCSNPQNRREVQIVCNLFKLQEFTVELRFDSQPQIELSLNPDRSVYVIPIADAV